MRWLFCLLVLLCVVNLAGCTGQSYHYTQVPHDRHQVLRVIPVYVDELFSGEDKIVVDNALKEWNYALNGYVVFSVKTYHFDMQPEQIREAFLDDGLLLMEVKEGNPIIPDDGFRFRTLGWVDNIEGHKLWLVRDRIGSRERLRGVLLHELGHILGAVHIENHPSIMQPAYSLDNYNCLDQWTMQQMARRWHIPFEDLSYCYYGDFPPR